MRQREYLKRVADQIVAAVCQADERRAEARCGAGIGTKTRWPSIAASG